MNVDGRVALITGGRRIGAVVATELARAGTDVALVYNRSRAEADETCAAVRALGRRATSIQSDLSDPDGGDRAVDATVDALGRLDILVNMASLYRSKTFDALTVDDSEPHLKGDVT